MPIPARAIQDPGSLLVTPSGSASARQLRDLLADTVSVRDFGATGNGTTDDTAALQAALATGKSLRWPGGTYGIKSPLGIRTGTSWLGAGGKTTIRALAGFSGASMVYDYTASTGLVLRDLILEANSVAQHGIKTTLSNTNGYVLDNVKVTGATSHGVYMAKAIGASLISVKSDSNAGDGFRLEDSSLAALVNCRGVSNAGNGLTVQKGALAYSSGVRVWGGQFESNGDNGICVVDASSETTIEGSWMEANTNDGVKVGNGAAFVPFFMWGCNVFILANGGGTNWAVRLDAGVRGKVSGNNLFNSGGSRNYVYDGSDGRVDTSGNFNGNAGETRPTQFPGGSAVVLSTNDYDYEAAKWWQGPGDATTWTPVLTAKARSTVEVEIAGADDSASTPGTFIVKTWTTANNATRVSFDEIGGATNPKTSGAYYFPIGTNAEAPNVRWNGANLEIKQGSAGSDKMVIRVRARMIDGAYTPSWLV